MPSHACRGELLIVDDSPAMLAYLSTLLTGAGFRVHEALSGPLALAMLGVRVPDLIVLDVRMPQFDGFESCRQIKADPALRDTPVIFLSALDDAAEKVRGLKAGGVDFISKDFTPEELVARIDNHLSLGRTKRMLERERARLEERIDDRTAELSQSHELLMTVIDSGPDWIHAVDLDHRFLLVNRSMAHALGYTDPAELIGQPDCIGFQCHSCEDGNRPPTCPWRHGEQAVLDGKGNHHSIERLNLPGMRSNGCQEMTFESYKTALHDGKGAIYGLLCYRRDITSRLSMQEENRKLEQALWQAKKMEAVGQLAGGIAHDFNHLLSLILGYAEFAQSALNDGKTGKLHGHLDEIIQAGRQGQVVVAQLLAFSRKEESACTAIEIGRTVTEAVRSLRVALPPTITLDLALASALPAVCIKPAQIRQIVTNLVFNARDAIIEARGNDGHGLIRIALRVENVDTPRHCHSCSKTYRGDWLALCVADNGSGITAEVLDRIFEPFFTTRAIGAGTGLGLAIVHGIAHSSGGHVAVIHPETGGAEFRLLIPLQHGAGDTATV